MIELTSMLVALSLIPRGFSRLRSDNLSVIGICLAMIGPMVTIVIGASLWGISEDWSRTVGLHGSLSFIGVGMLYFVIGVVSDDGV